MASDARTPLLAAKTVAALRVAAARHALANSTDTVAAQRFAGALAVIQHSQNASSAVETDEREHVLAALYQRTAPVNVIPLMRAPSAAKKS